MNLSQRIDKIEQNISQPISVREQLLQRALELQAFVENNGEYIEQQRQEIMLKLNPNSTGEINEQPTHAKH